MSRQSLERNTEQDKYLDAANKLRAQYGATDLQLNRHTKEFASYKYEDDIATEGDDISPKDPAIVAADVAAQIVRRSPSLDYLCSSNASPNADIPPEAQVPILGAERQR